MATNQFRTRRGFLKDLAVLATALATGLAITNNEDEALAYSRSDRTLDQRYSDGLFSYEEWKQGIDNPKNTVLKEKAQWIVKNYSKAYNQLTPQDKKEFDEFWTNTFPRERLLYKSQEGLAKGLVSDESFQEDYKRTYGQDFDKNNPTNGQRLILWLNRKYNNTRAEEIKGK